MNELIQNLLLDPVVAHQLAAANSIPEAAQMLIDAAMSCGASIGRDALDALLSLDRAAPPELTSDDLSQMLGRGPRKTVVPPSEFQAFELPLA